MSAASKRAGGEDVHVRFREAATFIVMELGMVEFETERLAIRNFGSGDAEALLDYLHQPSARCFFPLAVADFDAAEAEARKRGASDGYLAVCLKESGQLIGDMFGIAEGSDYVDQSDTFAVGWNINPRFGGTGYGGEAAQGLFSNLFSARNARRLYAYVEEGNVASERICVRLGMRPEGLFRKYVSFVKNERGQPVFENTMQCPYCDPNGPQSDSRDPFDLKIGVRASGSRQ